MPTTRPRRAPLLTVLLSLALAPALHAQGACDSEAYAVLDFLLGDWRLVDATDDELGRSTWRRAAGGCVLIEDFRDPRGGDVHGVLYRDPVSGDWRGTWVEPSGTVVEVGGAAKEGSATLEGKLTSPQGEARARITFERIAGPEPAVAQLVELSNDGGATWTTAVHTRYVAAEPAPAPEAAPAAEPTAASAPTEPAARTRRERDRERAAAQARETTPAPEPEAPRPTIERSPRAEDRPAPAAGPIAVLTEESSDPSPDPIRMASPMQLQIPVGPVEDLPEGYGWSSRATAPYTAEEVSIRRVEVTQRRRGSSAELQVTLHVHAATFLERADLQVELLGPDGSLVTSQQATRVSVGRGIPVQSEKGAVPQPFRLELDRDTFDALFAGAERPQLRLTVTVRD
jgi:hypothetical protein